MHVARSIALAALSVLSLVACTPRLDGKNLEKQIKDDMQKKGVTLASVSCPANVALKPGTTFECACTDENGTKGTFDVTAKGDAEGTVEWKLRGKYENMAVVGDNLEKNLSSLSGGKPVDVKCPTKNFLVAKGVTFACDVSVGGETHKFVFTCKDDEGDWDAKAQ